jgi:4-hydroxy-tetrahydrodipicolinate reductase
MRIAIVGYGKMGQMTEQAAAARGHEVVARVGRGGIPAGGLAGAEVAIEFSTPEAAVPNVTRLLELGFPVVVGTTGWYARLDEVRRQVAERGGSLVYGANFSVGMNLFFEVAREAARLFARFEEFDPFLVEHHHKFKKDAPSGTALLIARQMRESYGGRLPEAISLRAGYAPGTHEVGFDAEAETVTLTHTARSRQGFAAGAVFAAERIVGRRGCFEFAELLFSGD